MDRRALRLRDAHAARVREAPGMARGAGGARRAFPDAAGLVVRPARAPLRRGDPAAPGVTRAMRWTLLVVVAVLALVASVALGPAAVPLPELLHSDIVWDLRAPRALLAFLVGGSLGVAGAGLQALVRNPLADPFLLGLSGGAGLGAVLAIALHLSGPWALPIAAFVGALAALGLVYRLGLIGGTGRGGARSAHSVAGRRRDRRLCRRNHYSDRRARRRGGAAQRVPVALGRALRGIMGFGAAGGAVRADSAGGSACRLA